MKKMMLAWLTVASLLMGCSGSETSVKGTYRNPVILLMYRICLLRVQESTII